MENSFEIPVSYRGKELLFDCQVVKQGYLYKLLVHVEGLKVWFEPDEERHYRAVVDPLDEGMNKVDTELLRAIAEVIEHSTK